MMYTGQQPRKTPNSITFVYNSRYLIPGPFFVCLMQSYIYVHVKKGYMIAMLEDTGK